MGSTDFSLFVLPDDRVRLARGWLLLGLFSLLASGLFALLLVLARAPYLQSIIPWTDFFYTALIVHVDLSVLVLLLLIGIALCIMSMVMRLPLFVALARNAAAALLLISYGDVPSRRSAAAQAINRGNTEKMRTLISAVSATTRRQWFPDPGG